MNSDLREHMKYKVSWEKKYVKSVVYDARGMASPGTTARLWKVIVYLQAFYIKLILCAHCRIILLA